jgi:hypothetical protein
MFVKTVVGWDWARPGETVCQSGTTSGAVCGLRNIDFSSDVCWIDAYGSRECYEDLILTQRDGCGVAGNGGDSGGPVFTLDSATTVLAKGTVTGADGSSYVSYQDFGTAWRDLNIWPVG